MGKKGKLTAAFIGILLAGGGYYYFYEQNTTRSSSSIKPTIETVTTGNLQEAIDVVGSAELVNEQSLSFNKIGTITKVNFKAGDTVKKGDVIAEIDNSDGETSVQEAKLSLENAKIALQELYNPVDASKIAQAKNAITSTKNNIESTQKELDNLKITQSNGLENLSTDLANLQKELISNTNTLELAKKDLELAKSEYEVSKKESQKTLENTSSNITTTIKQVESSFQSELTNMAKIIEQADYVLGVSDENKNKNDDYEMFLGAKNSLSLNQAKAALSESMLAYEEFKKNVDAYNNSGDKEKIKTLINECLAMYKTLQNMTDLTYQVIDNSVSSSELSDSDIENKKSTMYAYLTSTQNKISSLNATLNSINTLSDTNLIQENNSNSLTSKLNAISQKEENIKSQELALEKKQQEIENAKKNYETTRNSYEITLKNKQDTLSQLQETLKINELTLRELGEGPTEQNILRAKNTIAQAQLKLKDANESLDDYKLISPFDGVVRKIDYMVGDKLLSDTDKSVYIENPNLVEIPVSLDQVDIVKVAEGKKAFITFDAYPTVKVEGEIHSIDYTPVKNSGVVTYTAYLIITDKNFDKKILSGMTADIEIITNSKENVLTLSSSAISSQDNKYYVNLLKNGKAVKTEIITGLSTGGKTQILSGLTLGDQVSVSSFESSTTSTKTTTNSLFGPGSRSSSNRSGSSSNRDVGGPPGGF